MKLRIKEIAKKKGYTLDDVAKGIGITYTAFFRRIDNPKLSTLVDVANFLKCEVVELLEVNKPFSHSYSPDGEWKGISK